MNQAVSTLVAHAYVSAGLCLLVLAGCSDTSAPDAPECGNGAVESGEDCDDGNFSSGDGCTLLCTVETGWSCSSGGCVTLCGDGVVAGDEDCDDGNLADDDGCSSDCISDSRSENCTDGIDNDGDGLSDCQDSDCDAECVTESEDCSDSIDNDDDGLIDCDDDDCASSCEPVLEDCAVVGDEDGNGLADCLDPTCTCECGDGVVQAGEACDDGDDNDDATPDACRTDCMEAACGDGVVDTGEQCDSDSSACMDCLLSTGETCGDTAGVVLIDMPIGNETVSSTLTLTGAADDFDVPPSCGAAGGLDRTVRVEFNESGLYLLRLQGLSAAARGVLLDLEDGCGDDSPAAQCNAASNETNAWLLLEVVSASSRYFRVEGLSTAVSRLTLDIRKVTGLANVGEVCDETDSLMPCTPGSVCTDGGERGFLCAPVESVLPGLNEPCNPLAGDTTACAVGLQCLGTPPVCSPPSGGSCDLELNFEDLATEVDGGFTLEVPLFPTSGAALLSTCERFPRRGVVRVERDSRNWLRLRVDSSGAPSAVSVREACTSAASESQCVFADSGAPEVWVAPGRDPVWTVVSAGVSAVTLELSVVDTLNVGEACGDEVNGRCSPGLSCLAEQCSTVLAGACEDPIPALLAGEGDLAGTGLVVPVDTGSSDVARLAGCIGGLDELELVDYREQVVEFTAPFTGRYVASLRGADTLTHVRLRTSCGGLDVDAVCGGTLLDQIDARRGQLIYAIVGSRTADTLVVALTGEPLADRGEVCTALSCVPPFECAGGICEVTTVGDGQTCSPGLIDCDDPQVCRRPEPGSDVFSCGSSQVDVGAPCGFFAGLPACADGYSCLALDSAELSTCVVSGGREGDTCIPESDGCAPGFFCDADTSQCTLNRLAGEGEACSAVVLCESELICSDDEICVSLENYVCLASEFCPDGYACNSASRCVVPGQENDACSPLLPCSELLECGETSGVCQTRLSQVGEPCETSTDCESGLFCRVGVSPSVCQTQVPAGSNCNSSFSEPDQCADGGGCLFDFSTGNFRCS